MLGPVELRGTGTVVDAGPPRQRAVLAALAVDAGRLVLTQTVVDRVWGPAPPSSVRRALYVYISRIRRVLGRVEIADEGPVRLVRRSSGYLLDMDPDRVDIHRFRRLVEQARDPRRTDGPQAALLRQALDLWQGTPLADLPGQWAVRAREGWTQQRVDAVVRWADVERRLGNAGSSVGMLSELNTEYPLVEPLIAALMRALYAAGRGTEALDRYARFRRQVVEELGADPGAELQALHRALLRGDPPPARPPGYLARGS